jgi:hypothetical protein
MLTLCHAPIVPLTAISDEPPPDGNAPQLFDPMGELKLYGMKTTSDEIMAIAVKRRSG